MKFTAVCFALLAVVFATTPLRYDGYQVVEITVNTVSDQQLLLKLIENAHDSDVFWMGDHDTVEVGQTAQLALSPAAVKIVAKIWPTRVIIEDLQALFDENKQIEIAHPYKDFTTSRNEFFEAYRDYDEIVDYIDGLVATYPTLIRKVASIGKSYEGRDIFSVQISNWTNTASKTGVFWNGLQHCREWIAGHSLIYVLDALVTRAGTDTQITALLNSMVFHIVPVFNPDGYIHTRNVDAMWRKNRQPNQGSPCIGTDLNRNWRFEWALVGSSNNPCSDTYHGTAPYSGPETKAISAYVENDRSIQGYMDWHSSGNLWMTPWGCYSSLPTDYPLMKQCGDDAAAAIRSYRGTRFSVGSISNIIYPAAGSSADTTYGDFGLVLSYGLEIGTSFQPNAREIVPTGEEMLLGALVHAEYVLDYAKSRS